MGDFNNNILKLELQKVDYYFLEVEKWKYLDVELNNVSCYGN